MCRQIGKSDLAVQLSELNEKVKYYDAQRQRKEEAEADVSFPIIFTVVWCVSSVLCRPLMNSVIR